MPKRQLRRSFKDKGFKGRKIYGDRKRKRIEEVVEMAELGKDFSTLRLVGPLIAYAHWWIDIKTQQGKKVSIPKVPLGFDHIEAELDESAEDPYGELPGSRLQVFYLINAIDRGIQENEPRRRAKPTKEEDDSGFKDKASRTWTPVRVVRIPPMIAEQLQAFETKNRWKVKTRSGVQVKTFDLTHPKYGRDVYLSRDKDAKSPSTMYNLSLADKAALTEEEMDYLIWNIEGLTDEDGPMCPESLKEAKREAESISGRGDNDDKEETEDDLAEDFLEEDEEGTDDDLPWDDMSGDEEEEQKPRRKRTSASSSGRKRLRKRRRSDDAETSKPRRAKKQPTGRSKKPVKSRKRRKLRSQ